jgi:hypothetical protein
VPLDAVDCSGATPVLDDRLYAQRREVVLKQID